MKPHRRDERIALIMAEATERDRKRRAAYDARQAKGSAGLPPRRGGGHTSSIVQKPRYR